MHRAITAAVSISIVGILVAGCGGGGGSGTGGTANNDTLTKAEFIKEADAICRAANDTVESEAEEFAKENGIDTEKPTTAQQEEVVSRVVAPNIRRQGEEIGELPAPSGDEEKVQAILSAVESGAEEAEEEPGSLVKGTAGGPFAEATKLAHEYGLKVCGSG